MTDYVELFKEIDINNIPGLVALSVLLIIILASCIQPFFASRIEIVLMNKGDELKRISFAYIILFFMFGIVNYLFVQDTSVVLMCSLSFILMVFGYIVIYVIKLCGKATKIYEWYKERIGLSIILVIFPLFTYFGVTITNIKIISSAIICALVEIVLVAFLFLNMGRGVSSIIVNVDNTKWYVFKRIDDNYLLCGDARSIEISTKMKLLLMDNVAETYFEIESNKDE